MPVSLKTEAEPWPGGTDAPSDPTLPTVPDSPDLGRSVRVVGPVVNVDMDQSPHPKNNRGELGKALWNYVHNTVSGDPLARVSGPNHFADRRHFLTNVLNQAKHSAINSTKRPVTDPAVITAHIKAVARYMGADIVGIARAHKSMMYGGKRYLQ